MNLIPYLACRNAAQAIEFYRAAFGAEELYRLAEPGGRIGHAELSLAGSKFYLSDEYPEYGCAAPVPGAGSAVTLHLTVPDVDAAVEKAAREGATVARAPQDEFYGHRTATLKDPFGHRWMLSTQKQVLTQEEIQQRYEELMSAGKR